MQSIFRRYEMKYLISEKQRVILMEALSKYMLPDQYGAYLVQNLYFDTERWDVIRTSIEKPAYKEKLRLRCYGEAAIDSSYYLELKKKYKGIVYKRRIELPARSLANRSVRELVAQSPAQIAKELGFYLHTNDVSEKIFISYQRAAFAGVDDPELRVTFDTDIRFRLNDLKFAKSGADRIILPDDKVLMEIKMLGGMPMWMAGVLSDNDVFPTNFSKYGVCYTDYIFQNLAGDGKEQICA